MISREVCVDASLLLKLVFQEPDSDQAEALFTGWIASKMLLIAPAFCPVEVDSVIRQKVNRPANRGGLTAEQAELAFAAVQSIPVNIIMEKGQRQRAWELAKILDLPTVYDAHYLALAELRNCVFWTADARLARQCKEKLPYVHRLGNISAP